MKLSGYRCKIEYLSGKDNTCADLLSRIPERLESECIRLEPGMDGKAYQVNSLKKMPDFLKPLVKIILEELKCKLSLVGRTNPN